MTLTDRLTAFNLGRRTYLEALAAAPPASLGFRKPGDDYSLGGLAVHVNFVLEHYTNLLDTMIQSGFGPCQPHDPDGLEESALARARTSLSEDEVRAEVEATNRLHDSLVLKIESLGADGDRSAPVNFGSPEPLATSASDILGWLTGHYDEHVPHIAGLVEDWARMSATEPADALAVVAAFDQVFAAGDVDAVMALMTDDCLFDNTNPAPDGRLYRGQADVRAFWEDFFASTTSPRFETEEIFAVGDRVVARWRFSWGGAPGGYVRGVDLFRVRDGKVAEKRSYVKG